MGDNINKIRLTKALTTSLCSQVKAKIDAVFGKDTVHFVYEKDFRIHDEDRGPDRNSGSSMLEPPAVVVFGPYADPHLMYRNMHKVVKDKDKKNLRAKVFPAPKQMKYNWDFYIVCEDANAEAAIAEEFQRFDRTITFVYPVVQKEDGEPVEAGKIQLWWRPSEQRTTFNDRLATLFTAYLSTSLDYTEYEDVRLIGIDGVNVSWEEAATPPSDGTSLTLSHNLLSGEREVYVYEDLLDFPYEGTVEFPSTGEEIEYTQRSLDYIYLEAPVENSYPYGEQIVVKGVQA